MSDAVFSRSAEPSPPVAVRAAGSTIWDAEGRAYLDAAGGAVVVGIGHGRESVARVMADQAARLAYAHGSAFTSEPLERYAAELAPHLPVDDPAIYPVSGGSEAMETALKLARSYHLARGETDRWIVIARWGSYHGNTPRRARPVRAQAAPPPLRGVARPVPARLRGVSLPRRRAGRRALGDADELAAELERSDRGGRPGHRRRVRRRADRRGDARAPPSRPDGYWPAIAEVCRRHGVLLIADEVMTGFGRTGRWFGLDHWGVRRTSWSRPRARRRATGRSASWRRRGGVHEHGRGDRASSTASPTRITPVGAAVAGEVLRDPRGRSASSRPAPPRASGCRALLRRRASRTTRTSARSAVAACWSAWSWSRTARPARRSRARTRRHRSGRPRGPRARAPALFGHGHRRRHRRRPDPARPAVRHHRRGAGARSRPDRGRDGAVALGGRSGSRG